MYRQANRLELAKIGKKKQMHSWITIKKRIFSSKETIKVQDDPHNNSTEERQVKNKRKRLSDHEYRFCDAREHYFQLLVNAFCLDVYTTAAESFKNNNPTYRNLELVVAWVKLLSIFHAKKTSQRVENHHL